MARSKTTAGKRQVQAQKQAKAQAKVQRREARHSVASEPTAVFSDASESQLMEELAVLHRSLEAGIVPLQEFEERREHIRTRLEALQ